MVETVLHANLVDSIVSWVREEYCTRDLCLYADTSLGRFGDMPPRLYGFIPDVYVSTFADDLFIIGEAKRAVDWEASRTRHQLRAFLRFLGKKRGALLVVATEWSSVATARSVVHVLQASVGAPDVSLAFLDDTGGSACREGPLQVKTT